MREIKFRAWDTANAKIIEWETLKSHLIIPGRSGWEWMQFTGLKDKNGKEIYEGDIVQVYGNGWENDNEEGEFGLFQKLRIDIVTLSRLPHIWLENECFGYEGEDLVEPDEVEVIGNIYENLELLEKGE